MWISHGSPQALYCLVVTIHSFLQYALPVTGVVLRGRQSGELEVQKNATGDELKRLHSCLTGKRIVFIGPSTSKFDYIALAYFAEYGRWPVESEVVTAYGTGPNPLYEWNVRNLVRAGGYLPPEVTAPKHQVGCNTAGDADSPETFIRYTNYLLNGHEVCDAHFKGHWVSATDIYNSTENRVYMNGATMISYFQWFGDVVPPRGTFDISPMLRQPPAVVHPVCPVGQFPGKWAWSSPLVDFLNHVIRYARPTHLVISAAFWPSHPENVQFWDSLAQAGKLAVSDSGGHVFWRTTPKRKDNPQFDPSSAVDQTRFWHNGWQVFPAEQIVSQLQGARSSHDTFYDATHLKPEFATGLVQNFVQNYVCPA
jgi:hypothetical protein